MHKIAFEDLTRHNSQRRTKARIVREALRALALSPDYPLSDCEAAMLLSEAGDDILVRLMGMLK